MGDAPLAKRWPCGRRPFLHWCSSSEHSFCQSPLSDAETDRPMEFCCQADFFAREVRASGGLVRLPVPKLVFSLAEREAEPSGYLDRLAGRARDSRESCPLFTFRLLPYRPLYVCRCVGRYNDFLAASLMCSQDQNIIDDGILRVGLLSMSLLLAESLAAHVRQSSVLGSGGPGWVTAAGLMGRWRHVGALVICQPRCDAGLLCPEVIG